TYVYSNLSSVNGHLMNLFIFGRYGVQLFFFASAFTIFYSYHNRFNKETNPDLKFIIRRFFRIAPLYYLAILFYYFVKNPDVLYWSGGRPVGLKLVVLNILFLHGFNVYANNSVVPGGWSIAVEMVFYCLVPLLYRIIKNLNTAVIFF